MGRPRKNVITLVLVPLLFVGMAQAARAYTDFIDQFSVTKNSSLLFTDSFNDGAPPPSAPNFVGGNSASYVMRGTMGPETNNPTGGPGKLTIDSSGAIIDPAAPGVAFFHQAATLLTDVDPTNTTLGLKSGDTFSTTGVFDLVVPTSLRNGYGVFLTDGTATNDQDDYVEMSVVRNASNQLVISLAHQDFVAGTQTFIASTPLNTEHDEIALTLTRGSTSSNAITGSFAYIDGGVPGSVTTFANTTNIFSDENFTRAGFEAFLIVPTAVPEPSAILFLVPGLVGLGAVRRRLKK